MQNFKKIEGEPLESFKKVSKKKQKMRNFNGSLIVPKILKKGPFAIFNIRSVAKYQKKLKGGLFGDIKKNFEKKVSKPKISWCRKK